MAMREEGIHKVEVHVAGICLRDMGGEKEVLVARRGLERKLYPGLWECGGGQMKPGENFEEAVKRQLREELGVLVSLVGVVGVYEIEAPETSQEKIPGITFACKFEGFVNGERPEVDWREIIEWEWLPLSRLKEKEFIFGIPENISKAVKFL